MPEQEADKIEIRSDEVQEILSSVPSWMIRWGITLIFGIILGCLILSYFVKYPDIIKGEVTLSTTIPPAKLVTKTNGEIEQLFVADNEVVTAGQIIAQIRNPLSEEAVTILKEVVEKAELGLETDFGNPIDFNYDDLVFGTVQPDYNGLVKTISEYRFSINEDQYSKRKSILIKQINNYRKLDQITKQQLENSERNLDLAEDKYNRSKELYDQEIISKTAFYDQEIAYTNVKNEIESMRKTSVQNIITLTDYERQLNEMEIEYLSKKMSLTKGIETHLNNIKNEINNWDRTFVIKSPMNGRLSYLTKLSKNQFVESGKPLFAVIPDNEEDYIAYISVHKLGYGKLKIGQEVKMQLDNYPSVEYGQITGRVKSISSVPNEDKYLVSVTLNNGLMTTYNKKLSYSPEMTGQADIITKDLRIIERIFNQLRDIFDN